MNKPVFVHLHNHTDYSFIESVIRIDDLIAQALEYDMPAVAITDNNNMHGAIEFYCKCRKAGIKPIIGAEISVTSVLPVRGKSRTVYKLELLCKDLTGYRNLCRIVSAANNKGFKKISPVTPDILTAHSNGLICLSGGTAGELTRLSRKGSDDALSVANWYKRHFPDSYYIELCPATGRTLPTLISVAKIANIPLIAASDSRILTRADAKAYSVLRCIRTGTTLAALPKNYKLFEAEFFSPEAMHRMFGECPEALANTLNIAGQCNLALPENKLHLPEYDDPEGRGADDALGQMADHGLSERLAIIRTLNPVLSPQQEQVYRDRLQYELRIITLNGLSNYFLLVADYVYWARKRGIPVGSGRGSAGGSLVVYALKITEIDPISHGLIFERFLNPEGMVIPEIAVDFCSERREEVIQYLLDKYGRDRVARIASFGTMHHRSAVRDVGRAMGLSFRYMEQIEKLFPDDFFMSVAEALQESEKLKLKVEADPLARELIETAIALDGLVRFTTTHAAGFLITPDNLQEYLPVVTDPKTGVMTSQYNSKYAEMIGLVRFDFLGLKDLTIIDCAVKSVRAGRNPEIDLQLLPLDDRSVYKLFSSGKTDNIFQFQSSGMRKLLKKCRPTCFEDIVALSALFRPEPLTSGMTNEFIERKHGRLQATYLLPEFEPILRNTYGLPVYQEQLLQIASIVAGYHLSTAELLRRKLGEHNPETSRTEKELFVKASIERGVELTKVNEIFDFLCRYFRLSFSKAHAASYALIAYRSAWLKTHYPDEFADAVERCNK